MLGRQSRADAVDMEMAARGLPEQGVAALTRWSSENASRYPDARPGAHTVRYTPSRWAQVGPWPAMLASRSGPGDAAVSRAQVASAVADALAREAFTKALVATHVWGKGKSGTRAGSGPATLEKILASDDLGKVLAEAVAALRVDGARQAYEVLLRSANGLGPSFFTKFLYFAGQAVPPGCGMRPLILDRVLAERMRTVAAQVGRDTGHDPDGSVAAWVWADGGWSPHRYEVYLSFMQAAAEQLRTSDGWPPDAAADLQECALFTTRWSAAG
ncbi:8-oxoguanine DNA glycosylase OGG fold protein [Streptomyces griseoluteus]|uniref:8-oxoguanine DNA glycosylase OGG fold protein n=1 Tax=Streptomyces griseoluteus TaxID=29306 RepID=UPI0036A539FA